MRFPPKLLAILEEINISDEERKVVMMNIGQGYVKSRSNGLVKNGLRVHFFVYKIAGSKIHLGTGTDSRSKE